MTFQYIINHLHEPHLWCIVLTAQLRRTEIVGT